MSTPSMAEPLPFAAPAAPAVPAPPPAEPDRLPGMFELVLRGQRRLDELLRDEAALPGVIQRLLALSVLGLTVHGLVVGAAAQLLDPNRLGDFYGRGTPALWMPLAFTFAFLGALCICLPSFYFYTQLSGLDASFRLVTAQALRAQATTAVLMLGVLPFYAAWILAHLVGLLDDPGRALSLGMALPFLVGLAGVRAVYQGFCALAAHLPVTHQRRGNFLKRMVLCWGVVYSAIAPVALYRLADALAARL